MRHSSRSRAASVVVAAVLLLGAGPAATPPCRAAAEAPAPPRVPPETSAPARALSDAFAAVAAAVRPAVVSVYSEKTVKVQSPDETFPFGEEFFRRFFGGDEGQAPAPPPPGRRQFSVPQRGMGSGMIIDRSGLVLTNNHVVQDVDAIKVQLADRRQFEARIVSTDPKTDVAVIRIAGEVPRDLPQVLLGDSDALRVGDLVLAIGAPFGLTQTVTSGIISAKGRADVGIASYEDFLQTDTAINPGNSGGPLVNMRGEVIGMNSAIASGEGQFAGVGFAIPANMIKAILPTLVKGGKVTRGMIGVLIQDLTEDLARQFDVAAGSGALVSQVVKGSPAEKAGLKAGDVIVRLDGRPVTDSRTLRNLVAAAAPGTRVEVAVVRSGREHSLTLEVGSQPAETAAAGGPAPPARPDLLSRLGLSVQTLTPDLAERLGVEERRGVVVAGVEEGGPASLAGLAPGDVIVEADRVRVADVEELKRALAAGKGNAVLLLVHRKGASLFLVMKKP